MSGRTKITIMATIAALSCALAGGAAAYDPNSDYPDDQPQASRSAMLAANRAAVTFRQLGRGLSRQRMLAGHLGNADMPSTAGVTPTAGNAAGPLGDGWSIWDSLDISWLKDKRPAVANDGHSYSYTLGLDKELTDAFSAGVSVNYIHTRLDTTYNGGKSRANGLGVSLTASLALTEWLSLDGSAGYVYNHEKMRRALPWAATGKRHSHGYVAAAALTAGRWHGNMLISAKAGVIASRDNWRAYSESDGTLHAARANRLVQGQAEASLAWWLEPLMPYLSLTYAYDLSSNDPNLTDRDDFTIGGGFTWYGGGRLEGLSVDIGAAIVIGREDQRNVTFSIGGRWNF